MQDPLTFSFDVLDFESDGIRRARRAFRNLESDMGGRCCPTRGNRAPGRSLAADPVHAYRIPPLRRYPARRTARSIRQIASIQTWAGPPFWRVHRASQVRTVLGGSSARVVQIPFSLSQAMIRSATGCHPVPSIRSWVISGKIAACVR